MKTMDQQTLKELLNYNPNTGVLTWKKRTSNRIKVGDVAGTINDQGYRLIGILGEEYRAHRLAWMYVTGEWPASEIDHRNGAHDDNRWENLREATSAENKQNLSVRINNSSGFPGVSFDRRTKTWAGYINVNKKRTFLGRFNKKADAVLARLAAKERLHEFNPGVRLK